MHYRAQSSGLVLECASRQAVELFHGVLYPYQVFRIYQLAQRHHWSVVFIWPSAFPKCPSLVSNEPCVDSLTVANALRRLKARTFLHYTSTEVGCRGK